MMRNSVLLSLWVMMISMTVPTTKADEAQNKWIFTEGLTEGVTGIVHVPAVPKYIPWWHPFKTNTPAKLPLVINLHALGSNAFLHMHLSGFNKIADQEGFIVLYPNGRSPPNLPASLDKANELNPSVFTQEELRTILQEYLHFDDASSSLFSFYLDASIDFTVDKALELFAHGRSWNAGGCCGYATDAEQKDIPFLRRLVDYVKYKMPLSPYHNFEVDEERIYVTGMSNGGFMTHRVACEMQDIIAAAAPVAGPLSNDEITENNASYKPMWKTETFECKGPVPIYYFHNKQDIIVPYEGSSDYGWPGAKEVVEKWRKINNLPSDQAPQVESFDDGATISELYSDPSDLLGSKGQSAPVQLFTLNSEKAPGHCWPGNKSTVEFLPPILDSHDGIKSSLDLVEPILALVADLTVAPVLSKALCDTSETNSGFIYSKLRMHTKPNKSKDGEL